MPLSAEVRAFLDEPRFGVLATVNRDGTIHQSVMWFVLDGDTIVMNTARGRVKATNLQSNCHISVCIEDGYRFVTISGNASLIEDQAITHDDIRRIGLRYTGVEKKAAMYESSFKSQHRISMTLPTDNAIVRGF